MNAWLIGIVKDRSGKISGYFDHYYGKQDKVFRDIPSLLDYKVFEIPIYLHFIINFFMESVLNATEENTGRDPVTTTFHLNLDRLNITIDFLSRLIRHKCGIPFSVSFGRYCPLISCTTCRSTKLSSTCRIVSPLLLLLPLPLPLPYRKSSSSGYMSS